jgi:hypothetical protein
MQAVGSVVVVVVHSTGSSATVVAASKAAAAASRIEGAEFALASVAGSSVVAW